MCSRFELDGIWLDRAHVGMSSNLDASGGALHQETEECAAAVAVGTVPASGRCYGNVLETSDVRFAKGWHDIVRPALIGAVSRLCRYPQRRVMPTGLLPGQNDALAAQTLCLCDRNGHSGRKHV